MLTTPQDMFRPTWNKVALSLALGVPITLLGLWLQSQGLRDSSLLLLEYIIFVLPILVELLFGFSPFPITDPLRLLTLVALQFVYSYVVVCLLAYIFRPRIQKSA